ncbi:MAG TPA: alpha/beta hydrolase [Micromonosporaceae bacterium]
MRISVRGLTFDVSQTGPDMADPEDVPVLLLHGFPQNASMWDQVTPVLHANGRSTIAPDQRGYSSGARPSDVDAYAMPECVADAVAILDELDVPVVDLVGHDWGAIVGWHLAAKHPERVNTYTAVSVPHPVAFGQALADDEDQKRRSAYFGLFRQAGHAEDVLLEDHAARITAMFAGCPTERIEEFVAPMRDRATLTGALNWYRAMTPATMTCPAVSVPITFVWGEGDPAIGAAAARSCGAHVEGDYRFVPLGGVSHWVTEEAPGALTEAILARIEG